MSDNLYLFANNNGGQAEGNGSYRLYDMKIEGDSEGVESGVNYVDYLIGDGASWIDTGLAVATGYKISVDFILFNKNQDGGIYGVGNPLTNSYDNSYGTAFGLKNSMILLRDNGSGFQNNYYKNLTNEYSLGIKNNLTRNLMKVTCDKSIYLFANQLNYPSGNVICDGICKDNIQLGEYKVWNTQNTLLIHLRPCLDTKGVACMYDEVSKRYFYNQGTGTFKYKKTIRDFQPVLDSNNVPCLLDKINNKFYYNQGTGNFAYGGVQTVQDGYTEVEYIESNGTQYIDTEVVPNENTDIDMTCRVCDYSDEVNISNSYIMNGLKIDSNLYKYNETDTTVQPNLVASTGATLTMGSQNLAYLTDDEKEQAINNGWSLL